MFSRRCCPSHCPRYEVFINSARIAHLKHRVAPTNRHAEVTGAAQVSLLSTSELMELDDETRFYVLCDRYKCLLALLSTCMETCVIVCLSVQHFLIFYTCRRDCASFMNKLLCTLLTLVRLAVHSLSYVVFSIGLSPLHEGVAHERHLPPTPLSPIGAGMKSSAYSGLEISMPKRERTRPRDGGGVAVENSRSRSRGPQRKLPSPTSPLGKGFIQN